jgi:hypothetical protein
MPARKIIMRKMLGQDAVREIENVPHSNSTISRHTDDISHDAEDIFVIN